MRNLITKSLIWIILFSLYSKLLISQETFDPKINFVEAESYFLYEEFKEALPYYHRILRVEPRNYNVKYKVGVCYLNDPYQTERSIKYLLEASFNINKKSKVDLYKEKLAPVETLFYLGQAYRKADSLEKAVHYFDQFKSMIDPEQFDLNVVNAEIESCEVAFILKKEPINKRTCNLGSAINTSFAEIRPVLSGDGKTLIFTRQLQLYDAVFITEIDSSGKWSAPYNLTPDFALDGNSYTTGISYHGDEIFVFRSDDFDGNIYSSKKTGETWSSLQKLNSNINTKYWESHATISSDGMSLYFTSNRKGTHGGLDIYVSEKLADGEWGKAVNLGPTINSKYNDDIAFLSHDNQKLYFSSLGHNGMGGYDIFVSTRIGHNSWSKPVNVGYPLNTTSDDMFFCPTDYGEFSGVYSVYNKKETYGLKDIFWVDVYADKAPKTSTIQVTFEPSEKQLFDSSQVMVALTDNKNNKVTSQNIPGSADTLEFSIIPGSYKVLIGGEGIKPQAINVDVDGNQIEPNIIVGPIEVEEIQINSRVNN